MFKVGDWIELWLEDSSTSAETNIKTRLNAGFKPKTKYKIIKILGNDLMLDLPDYISSNYKNHPTVNYNGWKKASHWEVCYETN